MDGIDPEIVILEPPSVAIVGKIPEIIDPLHLCREQSQEFEAELVLRINEQRVDRGLHPLVRNEYLSLAALEHALDMAENHFISHTGSDGSRVSCRVSRANYDVWVAVGENLAMGYQTPAEVIRGWLNSAGHRANLLSEKFCEIGVAHVEGYILAPDGDQWQGGYWVLNLGTRLSMVESGTSAAQEWERISSLASTFRECEPGS